MLDCPAAMFIAIIVAIGMTFLLEAMSARRSRLEVTLDVVSLPKIDEFLVKVATDLGWNETSTSRLRSTGEETFGSLLAQKYDAEYGGRTRLIVVARPQGEVVDLEFVATTHQENIEDQLAYVTEEVAVPTLDDLSLRLLRHHASAIRHQKFHGVDIVTVQVEGNR